MKPLSPKVMRGYAVFALAAGLVLSAARIFVSVRTLNTEVGQYQSGSVLPAVLHGAVLLCGLAAFSAVFFSRRSLPKADFFRPSSLTVYSALVTSFMLFGLDGYLIFNLIRTGYLELQPLFGHTPLSDHGVPLATLPCAVSLSLMLLAALPSAFYFLLCSYSDKCKRGTLVSLSTTPVIFFILYALHSYFRSDLSLNSPVKLFRILAILAILFYSIQESRILTEIPQTGLYLAGAGLAIFFGLTVSVSDIVLFFMNKVSLPEGFFAPTMLLCASLYVFSRIMSVKESPAAAADSGNTAEVSEDTAAPEESEQN